MAFHCNHIIMSEFFCVFFCSLCSLCFNLTLWCFVWFSVSWKWIGTRGAVLLQTNRIQSVLIHCSITVHGCLCVWCANSKCFFIHISVSLFIWIALFCSHSEFSLNWHTFIYLFIGDHVRIYVCVCIMHRKSIEMTAPTKSKICFFFFRICVVVVECIETYQTMPSFQRGAEQSSCYELNIHALSVIAHINFDTIHRAVKN